MALRFSPSNSAGVLALFKYFRAHDFSDFVRRVTLSTPAAPPLSLSALLYLSSFPGRAFTFQPFSFASFFSPRLPSTLERVIPTAACDRPPQASSPVRMHRHPFPRPVSRRDALLTYPSQSEILFLSLDTAKGPYAHGSPPLCLPNPLLFSLPHGAEPDFLIDSSIPL